MKGKRNVKITEVMKLCGILFLFVLCYALGGAAVMAIFFGVVFSDLFFGMWVGAFLGVCLGIVSIWSQLRVGEY